MDDATEDIHTSRLKRVQEKNKRAQARYRQKQKEKMQCFEEQSHKLNDDLQAMTAAYTRLEREKAALEVELHDLRLAATNGSVETGQAASSQFTQQPRPVIPHRPVAQPSGPVGWDRCPGTQQNFWNSFVRSIVSEQLGEEQAKEADVHPFQWKNANDIFAIYKGLIAELSTRLSRADEEHSSDYQRAVADVIHAMRTMGRAYEEGLTKQQRVEGGANLKEEIQKAHGPPPPNHWHRVLSAARVSPGQKDRILDLRASHLQRVEEIIRQRKDIVWELQQATVMPESASKRQAAFAKAVQSTKQLHDSLATEHLVKEEFFRTVCHQVLNEVQEARILVTAFPYLVDIAAVCDLMAAEPDSVTFDSDGDNEPMMSRGLPAILQIPAVVDSDLTPDLYINAFAWGCDKGNSASKFRQPQEGFRPTPALLSKQLGAGQQIAAGRQGSGFMPPPYLNGRHR